MDEPFASIDSQTRADLEELTMKMQRAFGMTVIIVTRDVDEAVYMSNKVIVLGGASGIGDGRRSSDTAGRAGPVVLHELGTFGSLRMDALRRIRPDLAGPLVSVA